MTHRAIQETIELAKTHEAKTHHLACILDRVIGSGVHIAIKLPEENPTQTLLDFVIAYIEHVPSFLEAARDITENANLQPLTTPILALAENYFIKPPEIVSGHVGLDELMDEAYLAHRLMEEVNDRLMMRTGVPLLPMDMTMSNIVIHSLIGEPFANELDDAVHYAVDLLMAKENVFHNEAFEKYIESHKGNRWSQELERWPCLMDELAIDLQFNGI